MHAVFQEVWIQERSVYTLCHLLSQHYKGLDNIFHHEAHTYPQTCNHPGSSQVPYIVLQDNHLKQNSHRTVVDLLEMPQWLAQAV
jgi:glutaredoxin